MFTIKHLCGAASLALTLLATSGQAQNYFAGSYAGASNTTGWSNTFVGSHSGRSNTTGGFNTFLGGLSGHQNISGKDNVFIGFGAGRSNTTGSKSVFIGYMAGFSTKSVEGQVNLDGNVFIGNTAGFKNINGFYNTFLGDRSGYENTTGAYNTFLGNGSGSGNTTGLGNTFIGYVAGSSNTTASANSFFGNLAGFRNTTGSNNAFFGSGTGQNNTTGTKNTFMGSGAGNYNTVGGYNSFMGYQAGYQNTSGSQNTFTGYESGSNNTTGIGNTFTSYSAGSKNTSGLNNTFVGTLSGNNNTGGSSNSYFGYNAGNPSNLSSLSKATAIGANALVSRSNSLVLGSIKGKNGASSNVNVGIGVDAPTYQLHLSTDEVAKPGGGSWKAASDKRLKADIKEFTDGLSLLLQIKPVKFHYNGKAEMPTDKEFVGVIAQEIQPIAPYMVGEFLYQDTTGKEEKYLDYDGSALTYVLVNAVKEQQEQLEAKDVQIEAILKELKAIKEQVARLNAGLTTPADNGSVARLWQNTPNPYDQTTVIKYFIPQSARVATIKVFNASGQQVGDYALSNVGEGEITLSANQLAAGTYLYKLFVDGVNVDSKKLVLAK